MKAECNKQDNGVNTVKTKTAYIFDMLRNPEYIHGPRKELLSLTKAETRVVMMARNGMLLCGSNFKGTMREECNECKVKDNESHRLNWCKKWQEKNKYGSEEKVSFENIYSSDVNILRETIQEIMKVWDLRYGSNKMHT